MKRHPIYQSGQPLIAGRGIAWKLLFIVSLSMTIALLGGFLGTGLAAQANTEVQPAIEENTFITPAAADNARNLADEVRSTVMCTEETAGDTVCQERSPNSDDQIPVTGAE
jgi:hypothetical protein